VELAYAGLGDPYPVGADNVHPFWEGENHLKALATCAAGDAVPRFYVFPRYLSHLFIISWILSFKFLVNLFYKRVLWFLFSVCCEESLE